MVSNPRVSRAAGNDTGAPQPLDGVKILDFSQIVMGPVATQLLADHGAEVLKIERPGIGDLFRRAVVDPDAGDHPAFGALNRNKRSLALDLRSRAGRELVYDLVPAADVVVNNYRPGTMERLGLGYERLSSLNAGIIYAQGTGFGSHGEYVRKGGQDILAQALTGTMARQADPAHPTAIYPLSLADYTAGMHMVQGILLALIHRGRTGQGQMVEVSLYDSLLAVQVMEATMRMMRDSDLNWAMMPLVGTFPAADGEVVIVGAFRPDPLRDICEALGIEDLSERPEFSSMEEQARNRTRLHDLLGEVIARFPVAEVIARLESHDLLCAPVRTLDEALDDPHTWPMIVEMTRAGRPPLRSLASPVHLSGTPAGAIRPPPRLGEGADEALADYGIDRSRVVELREAGVVA